MWSDFKGRVRALTGRAVRNAFG